MNPWWEMVSWHYFAFYQLGKAQGQLGDLQGGKISPVSESCVPQDTDTMYSIYNHSWMAHVSDFGLVSNGSEQRQLLAPEACLAGESLLWKKKRGSFPGVSSLQWKDRKSVANCCCHDMDSIRHGKIPAKRQYLEGSAEALRGQKGACHTAQKGMLYRTGELKKELIVSQILRQAVPSKYSSLNSLSNTSAEEPNTSKIFRNVNSQICTSKQLNDWPGCPWAPDLPAAGMCWFLLHTTWSLQISSSRGKRNIFLQVIILSKYT